ncbi:DNA/RNA polymerases superfamily protein [Gossypium australe]|uniref:DNA/RNA polymerases superfamily protein n=1 Tax=Gossypium australe TaxID=47621 RepID=A0A5B6V8S8_9ROSI|nr:DNA/RNA polymerases superfamily protein [Gossypium australe]
MAPYEALYGLICRLEEDIEFSVDDQVFLKVFSWKEVFRFRRKGKLSPRFIGPYCILKHIGLVAYQLELPPEFYRIHDVFMSQYLDVKALRKKKVPLVKVLSWIMALKKPLGNPRIPFV